MMESLLIINVIAHIKDGALAYCQCGCSLTFAWLMMQE